MKQQILDKISELVALVNLIQEGDVNAELAALRAQVEDLQKEVDSLKAQIAAKDAVLVDVQSKLLAANNLFKQGDALIDDPA